MKSEVLSKGEGTIFAEFDYVARAETRTLLGRLSATDYELRSMIVLITPGMFKS